MARTPRLYELDGAELPLSEWARRAGISYWTLHTRLRGGETLEQALQPRERKPGARPGVPRSPRACIICGTTEAPLSRTSRCDACRGVQATGGAIDAHTPYAQDLAAQAFVATHPDGATLEQVGDAMGITRERVRQIEAEALRHFRQRARLAGIPLDALGLIARRAS